MHLSTVSSLGLGLIAVSLLFGATARAAEYFVAPTGNDSNPGTQAQPFGTLAKACGVVQPGDTCWLREGVYREVLKPQVSGQEGKPITFKAWSGENVVLSGLDKLAGWQQVPGTSIWQAPMAWDLKDQNQVFCAGQMMFEARWPHKKTTDPMNPEGAAVKMGSGKDGKGFVCDTLNDFPPDVWQGATVWMLAQAQWSSWSSTLTGYDPAQKRLEYAPIASKDYDFWVLKKHLPGVPQKGTISLFYIGGNRALLQAPGEWYYDASAGNMLVIPPAGHESDFATAIEAKRRTCVVDLSNCSYITLSGVQVLGATLTMADAHHCQIDHVKALYICHSRGGATINHLPAAEGDGIMISGDHNILRDSEVGWSAGNGVSVKGEHNAVVNCSIHDCDYFGSYNAPVAFGGEENLLSHCTIARGGRDCVQPNGINCRIEYNDISQAGRICSDLAMIYSAGHDGGNTEIAYNWVHDAQKAMCSGIYLDNYSRDFIVHHNVVWAVPLCAMAMNRPSDYNMILNNTFYGQLGSKWGPWKNSILMPGCRIINNAVSGDILSLPEAQVTANVARCDLGTTKPDDAPQPPIPDAPGVALAGITPQDAGDHPSIGAYQQGETRWTAGWDPNAHPDAVFDDNLTPLRNLLVNSSFDFKKGDQTLLSTSSSLGNGDLAPWQNSPGSDAKTEHFPGFNDPPAQARNAIQNCSLHFPAGTGEVFQDLKDLPAGKPLILAGYVRGFAQAAVSMSFVDSDGTAYKVDFPAINDWSYQKVSIPAKAGRTSGKVVITKTGGGDAYVDNTGLSIDGL
jgi:hypothetical protein